MHVRCSYLDSDSVALAACCACAFDSLCQIWQQGDRICRLSHVNLTVTGLLICEFHHHVCLKLIFSLRFDIIAINHIYLLLIIRVYLAV